MSQPTVPATEPTTWYTLPDLAERFEVPVTRVRQMIRERQLLAVRREGVLRVPGELVGTPTALKHLPGVLTLLHDAGYNDEEALRWLYTPDDTLPGGTPAATLGGPGATEVKRRAQAVGF
nr:Rv2175c family DNA-binding protein [Micromonospora sp. NBRC 107566]